MAIPPDRSRQRGAARYAKPALTDEQLLARLVRRGVAASDEASALRSLRHIGYYRLSPYLIPFRAAPLTDAVRPGTTFDHVLDLYEFDRELRLLVMDALERVEVAVRAALTDHMATTYQDPFWYLDVRHFRDPAVHARFVTMVRKTATDRMERSAEESDGDLVHRSALEHFLLTYGEPELPPSWVVVETLTIGQVERLVANLARTSDARRVGAQLGLPAPLLRSWLRSYVRVRNVCAHHGRLWKLGLGVYPALPRRGAVPWVRPEVFSTVPDRARRLYPVLVSLQSVLSTIAPSSTWAARLDTTLRAHPTLPIRGMGFPTDWRDDPFWLRATGGACGTG